VREKEKELVGKGRTSLSGGPSVSHKGKRRREFRLCFLKKEVVEVNKHIEVCTMTFKKRQNEKEIHGDRHRREPTGLEKI